MPVYRLEDGSGLIPALVGVQRQTILHFATTAERGIALQHPTLGMLTFIDATKKFDWWNGTAWVALV